MTLGTLTGSKPWTALASACSGACPHTDCLLDEQSFASLDEARTWAAVWTAKLADVEIFYGDEDDPREVL